MTGRSTQLGLKRPSSPSKRNHQTKPSQTTLSFREVRDILDSCRTNFNTELKKKKSSSSPLSPKTDRTLRAKSLNGKVLDNLSNRKSEVRGLGRSPSPLNAKIPMTVVREILQTCVIADHLKGNIDRSSKSAMGSPSEKSNRTKSFSPKSSSAPASPTKGQVLQEVTSKRKAVSPQSPSPKRVRHESSAARLITPTRGSGLKLAVGSAKQKKKSAPMDEVMKLHQDEGVMHLLHALPTSRRKTQVTLFSSSTATAATSAAKSGYAPPRRSSTHSEADKLPSLTAPAAEFCGGGGSQERQNLLQKRAMIARSPHKNNLLRVSLASVKMITPEELMNPKTLELLKKLPKKDYVHLWSSSARYKLAEEAVAICRNSLLKQSSVSPDSSSAGSDISSASAMAVVAEVLSNRHKKVGDRMLLNVTTVNKVYKDILIRSYPNFASIIMAPTTTGMKNSFNVGVIEEIIDALSLLREMEQCKAVLLTGLGQVFSQGIDLTVLTHDSPEKQRKSAEALAAAIRSFVKCLLGYPKLLVAGVNGDSSGLGVMMLPYFDIVYANDKAMLRVDYCRFGQIPEAFASVTFSRMMLNEMLLLGRALTAEEGLRHGLVSSVLWPDKFLEEIVPRIEMLENMSMVGVQATKTLMKERLKKKVLEIMEEESRQLVKSWTAPDFAKNMRGYLKSSNQIVFQ